ncbi:hypothetical protein [Bifidobacterium mongoliense]|uniref:hypothetical protein n=1 Tax=Bifidobacterium mongoliense TaxID=518643 RepID=UPI0030EB5BDB
MPEEEKPGVHPVSDDVGELHRRIRELELENALMRQVVNVVKKTQAPAWGAFRTGRGPG